MRLTRFAVFMLVMGLPGITLAGKLNCPDGGEDLHHRDVMATSAPEIKVRAANQEDSHRWAEITRPLLQKALKLAKTQRATMIQEGIERGCSGSQVYVGQLVSTSDKASGCDSRIVTRPAEEGHMWVQAVTTCKYDWSCCSPEEAKSAHSAGYSLEGPLAPTPANPKK